MQILWQRLVYLAQKAACGTGSCTPMHFLDAAVGEILETA